MFRLGSIPTVQRWVVRRCEVGGSAGDIPLCRLGIARGALYPVRSISTPCAHCVER